MDKALPNRALSSNLATPGAAGRPCLGLAMGWILEVGNDSYALETLSEEMMLNLIKNESRHVAVRFEEDTGGTDKLVSFFYITEGPTGLQLSILMKGLFKKGPYIIDFDKEPV